MKLLLINPKFPESFWSFKFAIDKIIPGKRTPNPPLGLATLAALTPKNWDITIVDENVESVPLHPDADIIGVCGMGVQNKRQCELLSFYREQGYFVVAGGSYASLCPEQYEDEVDTVIAGEAEYIWPQFCKDFMTGSHKRLYHETGTVSMEDSPVPRFDLLKIDQYSTVSLQYSRGCPYSCEFCDIIIMFGKKPRTKTPDQVCRELDALRELGVRKCFFVDDNFIGNKKLAKQLLSRLRDYQIETGYNFGFGTEASLNLAGDDELLTLLAEANFGWVFIGIESPDEASLKETKKVQNMRQNIIESVRTIYSHGIEIFAGFIIGFDNDTLKTFDLQYRFIKESGISAAMVGLLTAVPKTPLYERLEKDGRLIDNGNQSDNTKLGTNVIPLQMSYDEMVSNYRDLYFKLLDDKTIADRINYKTAYLTHRVTKNFYTSKELRTIIFRFIRHGLVPGGFKRLYHFLRTIPITRPKMITLVIQDWIVGLSMRAYIDRHFIQDFSGENDAAPGYLKSIENALQNYLNKGALEVSLKQVRNAAAQFSFSLKGALDNSFFHTAGEHLEQLMSKTKSSLTLHIEEFHESQLQNLNAMLARLSDYGDRINIRVHDRLRNVVKIDSSRFNLILLEPSLVKASSGNDFNPPHISR